MSDEKKILTVTFLGAPNAGKSTLLNRILGEKIAAVHKKPQMTRRTLAGVFTSQNIQIVILDTPGWHQSDKSLNKRMRDELTQAMHEADLVVALIDGRDDSAAAFSEFLTRYLKDQNSVIALTKRDLMSVPACQKTTEKLKTQFNVPVFPLSGVTGEGVPEFLIYLCDAAQPGDFVYPEDELTTASMREIAENTILESLMENLHQELPYQLAVLVEDYEETPKKHKIEASIVVNRASHKGMILEIFSSAVQRG